MKSSFGISNFLEGISSLPHSTVFFYFCTLFKYEGILISPSYSLELCIHLGMLFLSSLPFASLLFSAICKAASNNYFAFLHFFLWDGFGYRLLYTMSQPLSIVLQALYQI